MTAGAASSIAPAAMTMGDPSGIGPEIAIKAWIESRIRPLPPFFVLADPDHLDRLARRLGLDAPVRACEPHEATRVFTSALPVVALPGKILGTPGRPEPADAELTIGAIARAVEFVRSGAAACVITNPISKNNLYKAGFKHPGHTEFLGELAERLYGAPVHPVMMLWSPALAVAPVTIHIALAQVFAQLSTCRIVDTARIVAHDLRTRFGKADPRLAVAGLNPHAGENGAMGREDIDIVKPAIAALVAEGIDASGPYPPDTMFHAAARARYDAAICMYHDQALIPVKTLAFDSAVNVTLGLPFVRTSPDHGTAYDIAGSGKASAASLIAALELAARIAPAEMDARCLNGIDDLPPLRDVVRTYDLVARKSLGQNFLFDLNLTSRIARAAGNLERTTVIEVGPGPGGLTRALLASGAANVVAIERDERCLAALAEISTHYPQRLQIIAGDALSIDYASLARDHGEGRDIRIVANLPYNVATPLLTGWLEGRTWPPFWSRLVLMFQREVAERIVATPRQRADYGRLSVLCGWRTQARLLFDLPPSAFTPPPKVTSSMVELIPRDHPDDCNGDILADVTRAAFGQRRKMLRQSLKPLTPQSDALIAAAGLAPTARAEEIDVPGFAALARQLEALRRKVT